MKKEHFKNIRKSLKMTQHEFGESLCLSKRQIINLENGSSAITSRVEKFIKLLWPNEYKKEIVK